MDKDGTNYDTYMIKYDKIDRAICEGKRGFIKIHTAKGTDKVLGATVVGGPAAEMVSIITNGMHNGLGLTGIGKGTYPYPTFAEGIKKLSDEYTSSRVNGVAKSLLRGVLSMRKLV